MEGDWSNTAEIEVTFDLGAAGNVGLRLGEASDSANFAVRYDRASQTLDVAGTKVPYPLPAGKNDLSLHAFIDRSVEEIFVNDGALCVTRTIPLEAKDRKIQIEATGGTARVTKMDIYEMLPIWN